MKPTFTHEADFRQERDFGAKVGATMEFVVAHWRPLLKCLAYFVMPPALLMGIGLGLVTNQVWNQAARDAAGTAEGQSSDLPNVASMVGGGAVAAIGGLIAFLLLTSAVYGYLRVRLELDPAETVMPAQVWAVIRQRLGRTILAWLFLSVVVGGAFGLAGVLLALVHPGLLVLLFFPFFYVLPPLALYFPILWLEDLGLPDTLRRCFYLIGGKWWSTLGLYLVIALIQSMVSIVFALPQYAVMLGKFMKLSLLSSDAFGMTAQCIYTTGIMLTNSIVLTAMAFQYFNLVERKDGVGLHRLIDSLGQAPVRVANEAYRPEDEGEY